MYNTDFDQDVPHAGLIQARGSSSSKRAQDLNLVGGQEFRCSIPTLVPDVAMTLRFLFSPDDYISLRTKEILGRRNIYEQEQLL